MQQVNDILERISDAFVALDREWRYTYVNRKAAEALGREPEELRGKNVWQLFPETIGAVGYEQLHRAAADQVTVEYEEYFPPSRRWVRVRAYPIAEGLAAFFQDVTEQKRAEEERVQLLAREQQARAEAEGASRHAESLAVQLQAQREEMECSNEELRTINEELGAAQAELANANEELRDLYDEMEIIHQVGVSLAAELDLQMLVQVLTDAATRITDAQFGSFFYNVVSPEGEAYTLYTLSGVPREAFSRFPMPRNTAVFGPTFRGEGVVRAADIRKDPRFGRNPPYHGMPEGHLPVVSYLAVPVASRSGPVLGGLFFGHEQEGVFTERHERIVQGIAAQAAIAIDNARLYGKALDAEAALRHSEERYRSLVEGTAQVVWTANPVGEVTDDMPGWRAVTGGTAHDIRGFGWLNDLHPEDRERTAAVWAEAVRTRAAYNTEYRVKARNGGYRCFQARGVPVLDEDGSVREWVGVCVDVTEQRRLEDRLRKQAAELAEADRRKDLFLAVLGHELRNPLAPIVSALQILRELPFPEPVYQRQIEVIGRHARHAVRLVDDLLDVARITRGTIELRKEPVELSRLVEQAVQMCRPLIESRRHQLTLSFTPPDGPGPGLWLDADPARLIQVVGNLLNNAANYTEPGGKIHLSVEKRDGSGDGSLPLPVPSPALLPSISPSSPEAVIRVRDTGRGLPPERLSDIFTLFTQIDPSHRHAPGGLGIGLTLVKSLVELHGGAVTASSEGPGRGSEFTVRLPIAECGMRNAEEHGPLTPRSAIRNPQSRRVLVVDDNVDAAETLAELLELWGHTACVRHDGPAAIAATPAFAPDLVLLDIDLPGMDGHEVARRLRDEPGVKETVLVALTGFGQEDDRRRSREAGFDHHLTKPVDPEALRELLSRPLAREEAQHGGTDEADPA